MTLPAVMKSWIVKGEVTYITELEVEAISLAEAEKAYRKRVQEDNVTSVKVNEIQYAPKPATWTGRPPGSPLRYRGTGEPDMPLTPPPPLDEPIVDSLRKERKKKASKKAVSQ